MLQHITRLVADGRHNAFTDLYTFCGRHYLTYRSSSGHGKGDGSIVLLTSTDGETWEAVPSPFAQGRNFYEGHMVQFNGRLYMFGGSFERSDKLNKLTQQEYVSWTDDGVTWSQAQPTFRPRWRFWRPIAIGNELFSPAYAADYSKCRPDGSFPDDAWTVEIVSSADGLTWRKRADIVPALGCNETQLYQDETGTLHAFCRRETQPGHMLHTTSTGDFTQWSTPRDRGMVVQGQNIKKVDGRLFMIGRLRPGSDRYGTAYERRDTIRTHIWVMEGGFWVDYLPLPSAADCSYAGIIPLSPGVMLVSYYSQHAYTDQPGFEDMESASDIYIAKIKTDGPSDWGRLTAYGQEKRRELLQAKPAGMP